MSNRRQKERQVKTQRVWIKGVLAFGLIATSIAPSEATGYGASFGLEAAGPVASAFASASSVATAGLSHVSNAHRDFRINTIDGNPFLPKRSGVSVVLDDSDVGGELSLENGGNKQQKQQLHNILGGILGTVGDLATAAAKNNPYYDANIFLAPLRGTQPSNSGAQSGNGAAGQAAHPNYGLPPSGPATQPHYGPASAASHQPSSAYIPPSSNNCQTGNCNSASPSPSDCIGSNCPQPNHRELPQYPTRKVLPADSPFAPKPNAVYPSHDGCLGSNCPGQALPAGPAPSLSQPSFGSQAPSDGQASFALQTPSTGQAPTPSVGQSAQDNTVNVFEGPSAFGASYSTPPPSLSTNEETLEIEEREPVTSCVGSNCGEPSRTYVPPSSNEGSQQPQPSGQQVPQPNRGYVPPPANQGTPACPSNNCAPPQAAPWHPAMNPNGPAGGAWHPGVNPGSNSDVKVVYVEYPGEGESGGQPAAAGGNGAGRVKLTESLQPVPSWLVNGGIGSLGGVGGVLAGDLGLGAGNSANAWTSAQANAHGAAANAGAPGATADGTRKTSFSSSSSSSYAYANSHAYAWSQTYGS